MSRRNTKSATDVPAKTAMSTKTAAPTTSAKTAAPPGYQCRFGKGCTDEDPGHRKDFAHDAEIPREKMSIPDWFAANGWTFTLKPPLPVQNGPKPKSELKPTIPAELLKELGDHAELVDEGLKKGFIGQGELNEYVEPKEPVAPTEEEIVGPCGMMLVKAYQAALGAFPGLREAWIARMKELKAKADDANKSPVRREVENTVGPVVAKLQHEIGELKQGLEEANGKIAVLEKEASVLLGVKAALLVLIRKIAMDPAVVEEMQILLV